MAEPSQTMTASAFLPPLPSKGVFKMSSFQSRVREWVVKCFGEEIADNLRERNARFLEEALELVQACGMPKEAVYRMVDHVFSRPVGEKYMEIGGVTVTLDALCSAHGIDRVQCSEDELDRIQGMIDKIRAKNLQKPNVYQ